MVMVVVVGGGAGRHYSRHGVTCAGGQVDRSGHLLIIIRSHDRAFAQSGRSVLNALAFQGA